jgi:hypothetical protein
VRQQRPLAAHGRLHDSAQQSTAQDAEGQPGSEPRLPAPQQQTGDQHRDQLEHRRCPDERHALQETDVAGVVGGEAVEPLVEAEVELLERRPVVDDQQQQQREGQCQEQRGDRSQGQSQSPTGVRIQPAAALSGGHATSQRHIWLSQRHVRALSAARGGQPPLLITGRGAGARQE